MILGIGEPAHERSRQDGRDTEQDCYQPYDHSIPTQRGDKNGDVGKRKVGKIKFIDGISKNRLL